MEAGWGWNAGSYNGPIMDESIYTILPLNTPQADAWYAALEAIYLASFEPAERAPFPALWRSQFHPTEGEFLPEMVGLLQANTPLGGAWYGYMPDANLGYLGYLFIDPHQRGMGWGSILCRYIFQKIAAMAACSENLAPRFTFWEVRIPEEAEDPVEKQHRLNRIHFYERLGARQVRVLYPCPPIAEGQPPLNFIPLAMTYPPGKPLTRSDLFDLVNYGLVRMNGVEQTSLELARALRSVEECHAVGYEGNETI
jgi:GNAT superfamily N-acetyltransferase